MSQKEKASLNRLAIIRLGIRPLVRGVSHLSQATFVPFTPQPAQSQDGKQGPRHTLANLQPYVH